MRWKRVDAGTRQQIGRYSPYFSHIVIITGNTMIWLMKQFSWLRPILIFLQPGIEDIGNSKPGRAILHKIHAYPVQGIDVKELPGHAVSHVYRTLSGALSGDPLVVSTALSSELVMHFQ